MAGDCARAARRGLLRFRPCSSAPGFSVPAPAFGLSHEFSITVGVEKTLVIVTGYGFEESQA